MRRLIILLAILATTTVGAQQVPRRLKGDTHDLGAYSIARATHLIQLVRTERMITLDRAPFGERPSDLRVVLVVLDAGSSTHLAPKGATGWGVAALDELVRGREG